MEQRKNQRKVLPNFHGIAIHDCWQVCWKYCVKHGICCAHLLRELNGAETPYSKMTISIPIFAAENESGKRRGYPLTLPTTAYSG